MESSSDLLREFGIERIHRGYADREFGSSELFAYVIKNEIDFHIRLKTSHKTAEKSFLQMWKNVSERVGVARQSKSQSIWVGDLCRLKRKYQKTGKTEHLMVASREENKYAIEEYKVRWQIETMFGCLKKRGFNFEETPLTMSEKISK